MQEVLIFLWLTALIIVFGSALVYLHPRVPDSYVHFHVGLLILPIVVSLVGFAYYEGEANAGPFSPDTISWIMSIYISTLCFIVQRFSIRYLLGDRVYRLYFLFFTLTSGFSSITWMIDHLLLFSLCWTLSLFSLAYLTALKKEWIPAKVETIQMRKMFFVTSLAVFSVSVWLFLATEEWSLSGALSTDKLIHLRWWETTGMGFLLILAAIIPAGQWPFHRWLLESAVTPTPVSAVMHAGLVNAGGLLLLRFSSLFTDVGLHVLLLLIAFISVIMGTGISFVQVDYKRQLVASTIAQMGVMLFQCALGAYEAAVIHLVLHGLFKATLFLQSGSVVPLPGQPKYRFIPTKGNGYISILFGAALGIGFWAASPEEPARLLSALLLGSSMTIALGRLAVFREGRWFGFFFTLMLAFFSEEVRSKLMTVLQHPIPSDFVLPPIVEWLALLMFIVFALALVLLHKHSSSDIATHFYVWLVHVSEPSLPAVERHPNHLKAYLKEGMTRE